ncbi:MAG: hypothetical protein WC849_01005 [Candidatus Paceibacterota bacterium]
MKKILYVGIKVSNEDALIKEIIFNSSNNLYIGTISYINFLLTELRTNPDIACLLFDDIELDRGIVFSREETNDNRTTVIVLIKTLSQNKRFDPKKIVVKMSRPGRYFEKYGVELFEQWKNKLLSYGVLAENIFEKPASNKEVANAVVKILNQ